MEPDSWTAGDPLAGNITTLYRMLNADGELLYVGISARFGQRFGEHQRRQPWWLAVARIEVTHYETRWAARRAERLAIRDENPLGNAHRDADPNPHALRALREEAGLSRDDLANQAGISAGAIESYENGRAQPGTGAAIKLADVLNVTLDELVGRIPPDITSP